MNKMGGVDYRVVTGKTAVKVLTARGTSRISAMPALHRVNPCAALMLGCSGTATNDRPLVAASLDTGDVTRTQVVPPGVTSARRNPLGAELVSTWPLTTRRSEPRMQVGLVNHPAQHQLTHLTHARRPSRSPWSTQGTGTGLSSRNPQDDKTCAPPSRRRNVGASHPAGRAVMPLSGRNEVTTALGEYLVGASHGRGFESPRLHEGGQHSTPADLPLYPAIQRRTGARTEGNADSSR